MNKLLICLLLFVATSVSAQKFEGFFKPVTVETVKAKGLFDDATWLFRPNVAMTAIAFNFKSKENYSLNSAGFGLSLSKFTVVNEQSYCQFSVNASLLTSVKLNETASTSFGGSLTVSVFNKLVGAGIGYIDKSLVFLTTISYSL